MQTLLITGFDPFGGADINPSWEAVKQLPDTIGQFRLHKLQLPTIFGKAAETVLACADTLQPDVIVCIGQASGREAVTPERIAVNIRDSSLRSLPDNAGHIASGEPCHPEGPPAYFSALPADKMAQAIRNAGLPGAVSNTAGTFVCNDTLYLLLHHFAQTQTRAGFIHIPQLPQQGSPSLSLDQITQALTAAINAL